jgi:deoxyinosine 3'endonuclease (endonuclease V)
MDISFVGGEGDDKDEACASLVILSWPSLDIVHEEYAMVTMDVPYIAGFLAFREVKHLCNLLHKVQREKPDIVPQLLFLDGNGILHHRSDQSSGS